MKENTFQYWLVEVFAKNFIISPVKLLQKWENVIQNGSKIKLPIHQHLMDGTTLFCCFKRSLGNVGVFCLPVGWKAYVSEDPDNNLPTATELPIKASFVVSLFIKLWVIMGKCRQLKSYRWLETSNFDLDSGGLIKNLIWFFSRLIPWHIPSFNKSK